jgi:hypothetical protein
MVSEGGLPSGVIVKFGCELPEAWTRTPHARVGCQNPGRLGAAPADNVATRRELLATASKNLRNDRRYSWP